MQACWVHIERSELQACLRACPGVSEQSGTCAEMPRDQICREIETRRSTVVPWAIGAGLVVFTAFIVVSALTFECDDCSLFDPDRH
jgi:hypothetical protein